MNIDIQIAKITESAATVHWEPASNVPRTLIEEHERTVNADVVESHSSGGQTIHTVSINSCGSPNPKKSRRDISDTDSGYVLLHCNIMVYRIDDTCVKQVKIRSLACCVTTV